MHAHWIYREYGDLLASFSGKIMDFGDEKHSLGVIYREYGDLLALFSGQSIDFDWEDIASGVINGEYCDLLALFSVKHVNTENCEEEKHAIYQEYI